MGLTAVVSAVATDHPWVRGKLGSRACDALFRSGFRTLGEAFAASDDELLSHRSVGERTVRVLREFQQDLGKVGGA
jgi:hypothetical protein